MSGYFDTMLFLFRVTVLILIGFAVVGVWLIASGVWSIISGLFGKKG